MKKYFDILGLLDDATQEAIQEAYVRLSIELDPKNNENQEFFVEEYEKLQEAYKALSNSTILKSSEKSFANSNANGSKYRKFIKLKNDSTKISVKLKKTEKFKKNVEAKKTTSISSFSFKLYCVLSILFSFFFIISLFFIIKLLVLNDNYLSILPTIFLSIISLIFCCCNISTIIGSYYMFKGEKKGYNFYSNGNVVFVIIIFISFFGNNTFNINLSALVIIIFSIFGLISSIFGVIFKNYNNELSI